MWDAMDEILDAGRLMYKQTKPRKAAAYTLARRKKRMRAERDGKGGAEPGLVELLNFAQGSGPACFSVNW